MKVAVHGATGRMGRAVLRLCCEAGDLSVVGAIAHASDPDLDRDAGLLAGTRELGVAVTADVAAGLLGADVVIDFSLAPAVTELARLATRAHVAIVSGTTGIDDVTIAELDRASQSVPVLWAGNMSLGIQVLSELVAQAVKRLGPDFDVEVLELHHKRKLDAPSGTARRLLQAIEAERPDARAVSGRSGNPGPREAAEVGVFALRGGDVIGDHTVMLLGPGERIELTHRATDRELFARGALRAARFVLGKPPGRYTIADVGG